MRIQPLTESGPGERAAVFDDAPWLLEVRRIEVRGEGDARRSPAGEGFLVVLSGTYDLFAGSGSWTRRGLRPTPFDPGRPVAVFLPPETSYRAAHGEGTILVVAARQPAMPKAASIQEELGRKPLLPLAGSGKAFDPSSGSWKPEEAFLTSAEALLPRRIARLEAPSGAVIERIAGPDYKALGLCVDEAVLAPGQCVAPPPPDAPDPGYPTEIAVYLETEGEAVIGEETVTAADGPVVVHITGATPPRVEARSGRTYTLFAYAGAKGST